MSHSEIIVDLEPEEPLSFSVHDEITPRPVLFLPGYSGAKLEVDLKDADLPDYCIRNSDPFRVWVDSYFLLPFKSKEYEDCWYRYVGLTFDKNTGRFQSADGVNVNVAEYCGTGPGFGTKGVDYLISMFGYEVFSYYGTIFEYFETNRYEKGKQLWAAPFDWRQSAKALQGTFFPDLISLIEKIYEINENEKITLVAHSHGNLVIANFLDYVPEEWKLKHIAGYVAIAGPWAGTSKTLRDILSGDEIIGNNWYENTFDIFNRTKIQQLAQGYGSLNTLLPNPKLFADFPIIQFPYLNKTLKGSDLKEILKIGNCDQQLEILEYEGNFFDTIKLPGVPLYCFSGSNVMTERSYVYHQPPIEAYPDFYCGNGDGTVVIESLRICQQWKQDNPDTPIEYKEYPGLSHIGILNNVKFVSDLLITINNIPR